MNQNEVNSILGPFGKYLKGLKNHCTMTFKYGGVKEHVKKTLRLKRNKIETINFPGER